MPHHSSIGREVSSYATPMSTTSTTPSWLPIAARRPSVAAFLILWGIACAGTWYLLRGPNRLVEMPAWTRTTTVALCGVLLLVPLLTAAPFLHIGTVDEHGNKRYRAYFTADFVWHEALTAELARYSFPPRNPYMAHRPLNYYWAYFLLPAAASNVRSSPIEGVLAVNALSTGLILVAAMFLCAWAAFPRPGPVAAALAITLLAASAEGLYAALRLGARGLPLSELRNLNIDAITSWWFSGLSVDGLPRSIWYNPQHSLACALGLIALTVAARSGAAMTWRAAAVAGLALGLSLIMSPFPGGAMTLIYTASVLWTVAGNLRLLPSIVVAQLAAIVPVALALAWDQFNRTFEGAGGAVAVGLSPAARKTFGSVLLLALGPVLIPACAGVAAVVLRRSIGTMRPVIAGFGISLALMFFITLTLEPIWIGWRAGQVLLVVCPALIAVALATLHERAGRVAALTAAAVLLAIGLPTTVVDTYNSQDTNNAGMGAGFRWTVVITPAEQAALEWIDRSTPRDAVVQMSLNPRGRETWSLIPSFARRRMSAGLPISLLRTPVYEERAARADRIFASTDPEEASAIARELRIDYLYVGRVERDAFGAAVQKFDARPDLFSPAFANDESRIYAVK